MGLIWTLVGQPHDSPVRVGFAGFTNSTAGVRQGVVTVTNTTGRDARMSGVYLLESSEDVASHTAWWRLPQVGPSQLCRLHALPRAGSEQFLFPAPTNGLAWRMVVVWEREGPWARLRGWISTKMGARVPAGSVWRPPLAGQLEFEPSAWIGP
jgi:hypothetical protein